MFQRRANSSKLRVRKKLAGGNRSAGISQPRFRVGLGLEGLECRTLLTVTLGLGVMGDSGSVSSASYKWPVQLQTNLGLNFGGSGLPYDHAVGGATSASVLSGGQDTALAAQVTAGQVTLGMILIGGNDFAPKAAAIANGTLTGAALASFQDGIATNIETATGTVLAAGVQGFLLGSVPDIVIDPGLAAIAADPTAKARLETSISAVNVQLLAYAVSKHIPYVDFYGIEHDVALAGSLVVGGVPISLTTSGTDPHDFFLDDKHPGIVGNAIVGNMWMEAMNKGYGTNLTLFTDQQILGLAGLSSSYTGETFSTTVNLSNYVVVTPSSVVARNLFYAGSTRYDSA